MGAATKATLWTKTFVCAVVAISGCGGDREPRYTLPRGSTIPIAIGESVATDTYKTGDKFSGELISPLREGIVTYVPLESPVEGVVDFSGIASEDPPRACLTLRLTALHAPNGEVIPLDTVPVVRESVPELRSDDVTVTTGLDVDLSRLTGIQASSQTPSSADSNPRVEIARGSPLIFTLQADISFPIPPPGAAPAQPAIPLPEAAPAQPIVPLPGDVPAQ